MGTLIVVNANNYNPYIFWYSAPGNFQPTIDGNGGGPVAGSGTRNTWVQFTVPGATDPFTTPWELRLLGCATVDAEGLQMIMAGGYDMNTNTYLNDVWQLSWQSSIVAPLISRLTATSLQGPYSVPCWPPSTTGTFWPAASPPTPPASMCTSTTYG